MGTWLDGFERITPNPKAYAGTMVAGAPRRFVCHFTQGFSRDPASSAAGHPNPPHLWVSLPSHPYAPRRRVQVYDLEVSARALNHDRSDPETNKQGAIQVEIEGFSEDAAGLSAEDLDWLADQVIGPACAATGVDVSIFVQGVGDSNLAAGRTSATRMSWDTWRTFNGICSHQNVPGNDHWDAGGLDLAHISARLTGGAPAPVPLEDDMAGKWHRWIHENQGAQYAVLEQGGVFVGKVWISHPDYIGVFTGGQLGPFESSDDGEKNGGRLDSLPWLGDAPPWADIHDNVDEAAIAAAVVAAIPPGQTVNVDAQALAKAVADELAARIQS